MSKATTLAGLWLAMKSRKSSAPAIRVRKSSGWVDISWAEYAENIEAAAAGLHALKVQAGSRVILISTTRYEWGCADFAVLSVGAATVPIYPNSTPEDTVYMINESGAETLILEGRLLLKMWRKIREQCPGIKSVVCFETDDPSDPTLITWDSLLAQGREVLVKEPQLIEKTAQKVQPRDLATLLFTSGTTGRPKGVLIGHEQGISEVSEAFPLAGADPTDVSLCFLPLSHILGRVELWGHAWIGFTLAYAESLEKVRSNLAEIRPTILLSVPRIFEKIYAALLAQLESQPLKRKIFDWAVSVSKQVSELRMTKQLIPLALLAQHEAAKRLVLDKVKEAFGGRLRFAISGGAPINSEISLFFHSCGILILEGYGLTETTAAVTVNTPYNYRFGSVGRPIGDVKIKIAEDGEILVKSKKVMQGYDKNPEATAEVLKDGWFHTGDIGEILPGGDLKITDRKKDLIKTAGGKYVAPQRVEGLLQLHPLIAHAVIHGDNRKYVVALLSLDRQTLEAEAKRKNISFSDWRELIEHPDVQTQLREAVAQANTHLASWESVKRFAVTPVEFTVEGGELTPSLKVKRKVLEKRFHDLLESLYA